MFRGTATVIGAGDGKLWIELKLSERRKLTLIVIGARKEEQQAAARLLYKEGALNIIIDESMWRTTDITIPHGGELHADGSVVLSVLRSE